MYACLYPKLSTYASASVRRSLAPDVIFAPIIGLKNFPGTS